MCDEAAIAVRGPQVDFINGTRIGSGGMGAVYRHMQRFPLFAALLLIPACDAAVTASAELPPEPVAAEANAAVAADANAELAVVAGAEADAAAGAKVEISADAFKLGEVTTLIQDGTIESAAELELAVNDPEAGINRVDIDLDGQIDHVQVVEVRHEADARVDFQMRVVPSSRATVEHSIELATASVVAARATSEVSFSASFSASIGFSAGASASASVYSFVAPARFEASAVFVTQPLLAFAFIAERPVYASIFVEADSRRWVPPGHLKHGLWKATGGVPGGHAKFKGDAVAHGSVGGKGHGKVDLGGHGSGKGSASVGGSGKGGSSHGGSSKGGSSGSSKGGSVGGSSKGGSVGGSSKGGSGAPKQASKGSSGGGGSKGGSSGGGSKGGGGGGGKGKK
jgi:hypothetical protein